MIGVDKLEAEDDNNQQGRVGIGMKEKEDDR